MPDWFNELLIAIGGGSIALVGVLTIFKSLKLPTLKSGFVP